MKQTKNLFFCTQCRQQIQKSENLIFVEDRLKRPFCSEDCASEFFSPMIEMFARSESQFRNERRIEDHHWVERYKDNNSQLAKVISSPQEVWMEQNELGESFLTLFRTCDFEEGHATYVLICASLNNRPSFIFHHTITSNDDLLDFYRSGTPMRIRQADASAQGRGELEEDRDEAPVKKEEISISKDVYESIEQKKSAHLADFLERRKTDDIPLEKFPNYEAYTKETLNAPDEVYKFKDKEGDELLAYLKSYMSKDAAFFHVVVCMSISPQEHERQDQGDVLMPVIAFPSNDRDLYSMYQSGEQIRRDDLKN